MKLTATAQTILRAYGDRTGRGRLRADSTQMPSRPPQGNAIITAEFPPDVGESGTARTFPIELQSGDVDLKLLTRYQRLATDGILQNFMLAYTEWIRLCFLNSALEEKKSLDALRDVFTNCCAEFEEAVPECHGRLPEMNRLRPMALENMLQELRKRRFRGEQVQEATVQKYLTVVSAVLSDAKRNEVIQNNPARMIDLPITERRIQRIPTPEEAQDIIAAMMEEPFVYRMFFFLALYTGCRRGELAALHWSDFIVQPDRSAILTIRRSRSIALGKGVVEGKTKNGRARQMWIDADTMDALRALRYEQVHHARLEGLATSEYVFTNAHGLPIHPDTFTKRLRQLYTDNGFPEEYHLHTLRHYFVTTLLHSGVDKQTVAELAGHGDTSFLERTYCHPQMERKQEAARVISRDLSHTAS